MTEAEWLACNDPLTMLAFLGARASERKCCLFAVACVRRVADLCPLAGYDVAIEVAERRAEGVASAAESVEAFGVMQDAYHDRDWPARMRSPSGLVWAVCVLFRDGAEEAAKKVVHLAVRFVTEDESQLVPNLPASPRDLAEQAGLFRDIFGNPFRAANLAPTASSATVVSLAQAAYEERLVLTGGLTRDRLAVLSDALEEAGCSDAAILSHLRSPGPHVRGCWAVDLILGMP